MENLLPRKNVNKNGGDYLNGKPLDLERRMEIIERFKNGEKVTSIAAKLKVTHGVVSKITKHYKKTGSYLPKKRSNPSEKKAAKRKAIKFGVDTILEGTTPDSRRIRNLFAPEQIKVLESYFAVNSYLNVDTKKEIKEKTKLTDKEITTWFTNKRCRMRKQLLDISSSSTSSVTSAISESSHSSLPSTSSNTSILSTDSTSSVSSSSFYPNQNAVAVREHIPSTVSVPDTRTSVNIPHPYIMPHTHPLPQIPPQLPSQLPQLHPFQQLQQLQQLQLLSNIFQQTYFLNLMQQQNMQNPNIF